MAVSYFKQNCDTHTVLSAEYDNGCCSMYLINGNDQNGIVEYLQNGGTWTTIGTCTNGVITVTTDRRRHNRVLRKFNYIVK